MGKDEKKQADPTKMLLPPLSQQIFFGYRKGGAVVDRGHVLSIALSIELLLYVIIILIFASFENPYRGIPRWTTTVNVNKCFVRVVGDCTGDNAYLRKNAHASAASATNGAFSGSFVIKTGVEVWYTPTHLYIDGKDTLSCSVELCVETGRNSTQGLTFELQKSVLNLQRVQGDGSDGTVQQLVTFPIAIDGTDPDVPNKVFVGPGNYAEGLRVNMTQGLVLLTDVESPNVDVFLGFGPTLITHSFNDTMRNFVVSGVVADQNYCVTERVTTVTGSPCIDGVAQGFNTTECGVYASWTDSTFVTTGTYATTHYSVKSTSLYINDRLHGPNATEGANATRIAGPGMAEPASLDFLTRATLNATTQWQGRQNFKEYVQSIEVLTPTIGVIFMVASRRILLDIGPEYLTFYTAYALQSSHRHMYSLLSHYGCSASNEGFAFEYFTGVQDLMAPVYPELNRLHAKFDAATLRSMLLSSFPYNDQAAVAKDIAQQVNQNNAVVTFLSNDLEVRSEGELAASWSYYELVPQDIALPDAGANVSSGSVKYTVSKMKPTVIGIILQIVAALTSLVGTGFVIAVVVYFHREILLKFMFIQERRLYRAASGYKEVCAYAPFISSIYLASWTAFRLSIIIHKKLFAMPLMLQYLHLYFNKQGDSPSDAVVETDIPWESLLRRFEKFCLLRLARNPHDRDEMKNLLQLFDGRLTVRKKTVVVGITKREHVPRTAQFALDYTAMMQFYQKKDTAESMLDDILFLVHRTDKEATEEQVVRRLDGMGFEVTTRDVTVVSAIEYEPSEETQFTVSYFSSVVEKLEDQFTSFPSYAYVLSLTTGPKKTGLKLGVGFTTLALRGMEIALTLMLTFTPFFLGYLISLPLELEHERYSTTTGIVLEKELYRAFTDIPVSRPRNFISTGLWFLLAGYVVLVALEPIFMLLMSGRMSKPMKDRDWNPVLMFCVGIRVFLTGFLCLIIAILIIFFLWYLFTVLIWWVLGVLIAPERMVAFCASVFMFFFVMYTQLQNLDSMAKAARKRLEEKIMEEISRLMKSGPKELQSIGDTVSGAASGDLNMDEAAASIGGTVGAPAITPGLMLDVIHPDQAISDPAVEKLSVALACPKPLLLLFIAIAQPQPIKVRRALEEVLTNVLDMPKRFQPIVIQLANKLLGFPTRAAELCGALYELAPNEEAKAALKDNDATFVALTQTMLQDSLKKDDMFKIVVNIAAAELSHYNISQATILTLYAFARAIATGDRRNVLVEAISLLQKQRPQIRDRLGHMMKCAEKEFKAKRGELEEAKQAAQKEFEDASTKVLELRKKYNTAEAAAEAAADAADVAAEDMPDELREALKHLALTQRKKAEAEMGAMLEDYKGDEDIRRLLEICVDASIQAMLLALGEKHSFRDVAIKALHFFCQDVQQYPIYRALRPVIIGGAEGQGTQAAQAATTGLDAADKKEVERVRAMEKARDIVIQDDAVRIGLAKLEAGQDLLMPDRHALFTSAASQVVGVLQAKFSMSPRQRSALLALGAIITGRPDKLDSAVMREFVPQEANIKKIYPLALDIVEDFMEQWRTQGRIRAVLRKRTIVWTVKETAALSEKDFDLGDGPEFAREREIMFGTDKMERVLNDKGGEVEVKRAGLFGKLLEQREMIFEKYECKQELTSPHIVIALWLADQWLAVLALFSFRFRLPAPLCDLALLEQITDIPSEALQFVRRVIGTINTSVRAIFDPQDLIRLANGYAWGFDREWCMKEAKEFAEAAEARAKTEAGKAAAAAKDEAQRKADADTEALLSNPPIFSDVKADLTSMSKHEIAKLREQEHNLADNYAMVRPVLDVADDLLRGLMSDIDFDFRHCGGLELNLDFARNFVPAVRKFVSSSGAAAVVEAKADEALARLRQERALRLKEDIASLASLLTSRASGEMTEMEKKRMFKWDSDFDFGARFADGDEEVHKALTETMVDLLAAKAMEVAGVGNKETLALDMRKSVRGLVSLLLRKATPMAKEWRNPLGDGTQRLLDMKDSQSVNALEDLVSDLLEFYGNPHSPQFNYASIASAFDTKPAAIRVFVDPSFVSEQVEELAALPFMLKRIQGCKLEEHVLTKEAISRQLKPFLKSMGKTSESAVQAFVHLIQFYTAVGGMPPGLSKKSKKTDRDAGGEKRKDEEHKGGARVRRKDTFLRALAAREEHNEASMIRTAIFLSRQQEAMKLIETNRKQLAEAEKPESARKKTPRGPKSADLEEEQEEEKIEAGAEKTHYKFRNHEVKMDAKVTAAPEGMVAVDIGRVFGSRDGDIFEMCFHGAALLRNWRYMYRRVRNLSRAYQRVMLQVGDLTSKSMVFDAMETGDGSPLDAEDATPATPAQRCRRHAIQFARSMTKELLPVLERVCPHIAAHVKRLMSENPDPLRDTRITPELHYVKAILRKASAHDVITSYNTFLRWNPRHPQFQDFEALNPTSYRFKELNPDEYSPEELDGLAPDDDPDYNEWNKNVSSDLKDQKKKIFLELYGDWNVGVSEKTKEVERKEAALLKVKIESGGIAAADQSDEDVDSGDDDDASDLESEASMNADSSDSETDSDSSDKSEKKEVASPTSSTRKEIMSKLKSAEADVLRAMTAANEVHASSAFESLSPFTLLNRRKPGVRKHAHEDFAVLFGIPEWYSVDETKSLNALLSLMVRGRHVGRAVIEALSMAFPINTRRLVVELASLVQVVVGGSSGGFGGVRATLGPNPAANLMAVASLCGVTSQKLAKVFEYFAMRVDQTPRVRQLVEERDGKLHFKSPQVSILGLFQAVAARGDLYPLLRFHDLLCPFKSADDCDTCLVRSCTTGTGRRIARIPLMMMIFTSPNRPRVRNLIAKFFPDDIIQAVMGQGKGARETFNATIPPDAVNDAATQAAQTFPWAAEAVERVAKSRDGLKELRRPMQLVFGCIHLYRMEFDAATAALLEAAETPIDHLVVELGVMAIRLVVEQGAVNNPTAAISVACTLLHVLPALHPKLSQATKAAMGYKNVPQRFKPLGFVIMTFAPFLARKLASVSGTPEQATRILVHLKQLDEMLTKAGLVVGTRWVTGPEDDPDWDPKSEDDWNEWNRPHFVCDFPEDLPEEHREDINDEVLLAMMKMGFELSKVVKPRATQKLELHKRFLEQTMMLVKNYAKEDEVAALTAKYVARADGVLHDVVHYRHFLEEAKTELAAMAAANDAVARKNVDYEQLQPEDGAWYEIVVARGDSAVLVTDTEKLPARFSSALAELEARREDQSAAQQQLFQAIRIPAKFATCDKGHKLVHQRSAPDDYLTCKVCHKTDRERTFYGCRTKTYGGGGDDEQDFCGHDGDLCLACYDKKIASMPCTWSFRCKAREDGGMVKHVAGVANPLRVTHSCWKGEPVGTKIGAQNEAAKDADATEETPGHVKDTAAQLRSDFRAIPVAIAPEGCVPRSAMAFKFVSVTAEEQRRSSVVKDSDSKKADEESIELSSDAEDAKELATGSVTQVSEIAWSHSGTTLETKRGSRPAGRVWKSFRPDADACFLFWLVEKVPAPKKKGGDEEREVNQWPAGALLCPDCRDSGESDDKAELKFVGEQYYWTEDLKCVSCDGRFPKAEIQGCYEHDHLLCRACFEKQRVWIEKQRLRDVFIAVAKHRPQSHRDVTAIVSGGTDAFALLQRSYSKTLLRGQRYANGDDDDAEAEDEEKAPTGEANDWGGDCDKPAAGEDGESEGARGDDNSEESEAEDDDEVDDDDGEGSGSGSDEGSDAGTKSNKSSGSKKSSGSRKAEPKSPKMVVYMGLPQFVGFLVAAGLIDMKASEQRMKFLFNFSKPSADELKKAADAATKAVEKGGRLRLGEQLTGAFSIGDALLLFEQHKSKGGLTYRSFEEKIIPTLYEVKGRTLCSQSRAVLIERFLNVGIASQVLPPPPAPPEAIGDEDEIAEAKKRYESAKSRYDDCVKARQDAKTALAVDLDEALKFAAATPAIRVTKIEDVAAFGPGPWKFKNRSKLVRFLALNNDVANKHKDLKQLCELTGAKYDPNGANPKWDDSVDAVIAALCANDKHRVNGKRYVPIPKHDPYNGTAHHGFGSLEESFEAFAKGDVKSGTMTRDQFRTLLSETREDAGKQFADGALPLKIEEFFKGGKAVPFSVFAKAIIPEFAKLTGRPEPDVVRQFLKQDYQLPPDPFASQFTKAVHFLKLVRSEDVVERFVEQYNRIRSELYEKLASSWYKPDELRAFSADLDRNRAWFFHFARLTAFFSKYSEVTSPGPALTAVKEALEILKAAAKNFGYGPGKEPVTRELLLGWTMSEVPLFKDKFDAITDDAEREAWLALEDAPYIKLVASRQDKRLKLLEEVMAGSTALARVSLAKFRMYGKDLTQEAAESAIKDAMARGGKNVLANMKKFMEHQEQLAEFREKAIALARQNNVPIEEGSMELKKLMDEIRQNEGRLKEWFKNRVDTLDSKKKLVAETKDALRELYINNAESTASVDREVELVARGGPEALKALLKQKSELFGAAASGVADKVLDDDAAQLTKYIEGHETADADLDALAYIIPHVVSMLVEPSKLKEFEAYRSPVADLLQNVIYCINYSQRNPTLAEMLDNIRWLGNGVASNLYRIAFITQVYKWRKEHKDDADWKKAMEKAGFLSSDWGQNSSGDNPEIPEECPEEMKTVLSRFKEAYERNEKMEEKREELASFVTALTQESSGVDTFMLLLRTAASHKDTPLSASNQAKMMAVVRLASGDATASLDLLAAAGVAMTNQQKKILTVTVAQIQNLHKVSPLEALSGAAKELASPENLFRIVSRYVFDTLDEDRSGSIGREEFKRGLSLLRLPLPEHEVRMWFDELDTDGSGSLSYDEFVYCLTGIRQKFLDFMMEELHLSNEAILVALVWLGVFLAFLVVFLILGVIGFTDGGIFVASISGIMPLVMSGASQAKDAAGQFQALMTTIDDVVAEFFERLRNLEVEDSAGAGE